MGIIKKELHRSLQVYSICPEPTAILSLVRDVAKFSQQEREPIAKTTICNAFLVNL